MSILSDLSRREREVLEILFEKGESTLGDVAELMKNPPTRPALRSIVTILEEKGHLTRAGKRGREHIYRPRPKPVKEGRAAWKNVLKTFFGGSIQDGLAAYLNDPTVQVSEDELRTIENLVREAREQQARREK
ncbi:MAG: BlaI/MecI/CopY family transcriptional regulator [Verrucomicrobiales bacterium]